MAQQIKVIDSLGNEHYHVINSENDIYFSKNNDGLYRESFEDKLSLNLENIGLNEIIDIIKDRDLTLEDLDFDIDDYEDEIIEQASGYAIWRGLKNNHRYALNDVITRMRNEGYTVIEPEDID